MARCYKFAIVRLAPDDARDERINIGAMIITKNGLDMRLPRRLDKIRAISAAVDTDTVRELISNITDIDERLKSSGMEEEARLDILSRVGPLSLSKIGTFSAQDTNAYEERVATIMRSMVDPEPATPRQREKRSKLLTQVKTIFRQERVLAKKDEGIESHRIVPSYALDEGLVADLVLKNGSYHVVETVDASSDEDSFRRTIAGIGIAGLVLERARMKFGEKATNARLVYNASASLERIAKPSLDAVANQHAELINWSSAEDRTKFIHSLSSLAIPIERKGGRKPTRFAGGANGAFGFH